MQLYVICSKYTSDVFICRLSCDYGDDFNPGLMTTFSDPEKESELRIGAYLALMNCPSEETVRLIILVLNNEPVNQGS